jgi:hypothetical protein
MIIVDPKAWLLQVLEQPILLSLWPAYVFAPEAIDQLRSIGVARH